MSMDGVQSGTDEIRKLVDVVLKKCEERMKGRSVMSIEKGVSDGLRRRHGL